MILHFNEIQNKYNKYLIGGVDKNQSESSTSKQNYANHKHYFQFTADRAKPNNETKIISNI